MDSTTLKFKDPSDHGQNGSACLISYDSHEDILSNS